MGCEVIEMVKVGVYGYEMRGFPVNMGIIVGICIQPL